MKLTNTQIQTLKELDSMGQMHLVDDEVKSYFRSIEVMEAGIPIVSKTSIEELRLQLQKLGHFDFASEVSELIKK